MHAKLNKLISEINLAKARRVINFKVRLSRHSLFFLNKLNEYGLIRGYSIVNREIIVYMKYINNTVVFKKIYLIKGKRYIKLMSLLRMSSRIKPSLYLLVTANGYKFSDECLLENISGRVIARIEL